ncbi:MAG TPA: hypothetical protein VN581_02095, partial [Patescibacteria group bacterium]|nr:hypothetical protein [Patescibacteria group bacterium]
MALIRCALMLGALAGAPSADARAPGAPIHPSHATPVTRHDGHDHALVFNRSTDAGWHVVRRDAEGETVLTAALPGNHWVWGARGDTLILLSQANADGAAKGWRAHRMQENGKDFVRIHAEVVADGYVDRSPERTTWAAERRVGARKRIVLFAENGAPMRSFGTNDAAYDDADPQFSPDGKRLLFRSNRGGSWELYTSGIDGSELVQLTRDDANDSVDSHEYGGEGPPRWSPDGSRIVWMRKFPERGYDLWVMAADGAKAMALTDNGAINDAYPAWSPDGRRIAFDSNREGNNEIHLMDAD